MSSEHVHKPPPGSPVPPGEVLHQRRSFPFCPVRMAVGGFVLVATIGYFTLYSNKKPEASAYDVAKVAAGVTDKDTTHKHY